MVLRGGGIRYVSGIHAHGCNTIEQDVRHLGHPAGMPCADTFTRPSQSEAADVQGVPPIAYGLYPYYIRTFVVEQGLLTLEEAIKKATSLPAQDVLGLTDRGILARDTYADIVLFDLDTIGARGTFADPAQSPTGIEYVLVNGTVTYENLRNTGAKAGKVVKRQPGKNVNY